jgi:hypothetical protein
MSNSAINTLKVHDLLDDVGAPRHGLRWMFV